jgi:hypothetical protein
MSQMKRFVQWTLDKDLVVWLDATAPKRGFKSTQDFAEHVLTEAREAWDVAAKKHEIRSRLVRLPGEEDV